MLLNTVYCRRCGRNLRAKLYTAINSYNIYQPRLSEHALYFLPAAHRKRYSHQILQLSGNLLLVRQCLYRSADPTPPAGGGRDVSRVLPVLVAEPQPRTSTVWKSAQRDANTARWL